MRLQSDRERTSHKEEGGGGERRRCYRSLILGVFLYLHSMYFSPIILSLYYFWMAVCVLIYIKVLVSYLFPELKAGSVAVI